jgi:uncharacterized membrane protein
MVGTKDGRADAQTSSSVFGDQRPPWRAGLRNPAPQDSSAMRSSPGATNASLVQALGWLSVGLGVAALLAPQAISQRIGSRGHALVARLCGARELVCGIGLLSGRSPERWLWARVAGDAIDLGLLGGAMSSPRNDRARTLAATVAVLGLTGVDVFAARRARERSVADAQTRDSAVYVEKTFAVNRPPETCYDLWRNVENLPRFMKHIDSVTAIGPGLTHWIATTPGGMRIEWDAEITNDQPGRLIAWRSLDEADVDHAGVVRFDPDPDGGGTIVRVEMHYAPPAGRFRAAVGRLFGEDPSQAIHEDLRSFKRLVETGEILLTEGRAHGKRGMLHRLFRSGRRQ